jgi:hypothetical protein
MMTLGVVHRRRMLALAAFTLLGGGCTRTAQTTPAPASPAAQQPAPAVAPTPAAQSAPSESAGLPDRLSDAAYWQLEQDISEPGGYFRIEDNYTSNEMEVGQIFTQLRDTHVSGDVYMGVGPEQNFTYIAAIRPRMAFIVDIRRQAVMQHLMFKGIFEMASDRAEFISLLFGKPRPAIGAADTSIQRIWELYRNVASDSALSARTWTRLVDRLTKVHGFTFTKDESDKLKAVFDAFYYYGPSIATRGYSGGRGGDFAELTAYSMDQSGRPRSFLSSEENYRYVKSLHERNLIVPVSGDFAGPKAIRAIGTYLKQHDGVVRAFYVSNVEQYLFGDGVAQKFYANVATLPLDSGSVFIRPYSMRGRFGGGFGGGPTLTLCPMKEFLVAVQAGLVLSNERALSCGK